MKDSQGGVLIAGLAADEWLRWTAVDITGPLAEARGLRDLSPVAATALGRALSGAALLFRHALRTPERLRLTVRGDGLLGEVVAEISADRFRGRVGNPRLANVHFGQRRRRLGDAVGTGRLEVTRENSRGAFHSQSDLVTGEIGSDLAHYLLQSEQTRSVLAVGEMLNPDGIDAAGGYLIEVLPGAPEEVVATLEQNLAAAPAWSECLSVHGLEAALASMLTGLDFSVREQDALEYRCGCNRQAVLARLQALPEVDRLELQQATALVAACEYCGTEHAFEAGELEPGGAAAAAAEISGSDVQ